MSRRRRPAIPNIPRGLGKEEQRFYAAVKEALDISVGDRGNELESNPTWRDLLSYGFAERSPSGGWVPIAGVPTDPTVIVDIPGLPDYNNTSTPPQPTNAQISVGVNNVYLTWDNPGLDWLEYAEIYHVEIPVGDPAPLVASATFLARTFPNGGAYAHSVDPETRHFYWIRFVSYRGTYGPWHATAGLEGVTELLPQQQLDAITDAINNGQLATDLQASISVAQADASQALIDAAAASAAAAVVSGDLDTVEGEILAAREGEASLVANLNSIQTTLQGQVTGIQNEIFLARDGEATLAAKLTSVTATADAAANTASTISTEVVSARNGEADLATYLNSITTSVGALNTVVVDEIARVDDSIAQVGVRVDDVSAEYFIKTDVNGLVSGFGVFNDGVGSDMIFNVNRFAVGAPGQTSFTFVVDNDTNSVLMSGAKIVDASITSAKIDNITVDQIVGDVANFVNANITSVNVDTIVGDTSTFVESNIGVGAIKTAMIGFGAVDTLKIAGNAVTLPLVSVLPNDVSIGNSTSYSTLLSVDIPTDIVNLNRPITFVGSVHGVVEWPDIGSSPALSVFHYRIVAKDLVGASQSALVIHEPDYRSHSTHDGIAVYNIPASDTFIQYYMAPGGNPWDPSNLQDSIAYFRPVAIQSNPKSITTVYWGYSSNSNAVTEFGTGADTSFYFTLPAGYSRIEVQVQKRGAGGAMVYKKNSKLIIEGARDI